MRSHKTRTYVQGTVRFGLSERRESLHQTELGTGALLGSGRLRNNRPETASVFRLLEGNNRNRREVSGRELGRLLHIPGKCLFCAPCAPPSRKKCNLRELVGRHITRSPYTVLPFYVLHALRNTRHTSRVV